MYRTDRTSTGFTIIELLIVIIVIGILAAIVLVAYSGIQNQALDKAATSDLNNFEDKVEQFYTINSRYPMATPTTELTSIGMKFSDASLTAGGAGTNMLYCTITSGYGGYAVIGQGRTGTRFVISSLNRTIISYAGSFSAATACPAVLSGSDTWRWSISAGAQQF